MQVAKATMTTSVRVRWHTQVLAKHDEATHSRFRRANLHDKRNARDAGSGQVRWQLIGKSKHDPPAIHTKTVWTATTALTTADTRPYRDVVCSRMNKCKKDYSMA